MQEVTELRRKIAVAALLAALVASVFFKGIGDNLVVLVTTAALLLVAASLPGVVALRESWIQARTGVAAAVFALIVLVLNVRLSLSKDSSFAPAWVLAALPLSFLASGALREVERRWIGNGIVAVVGLLAAISVVRLLLFGERARLPLTDPNNYASLMYLVWIPFVHQRLVARWRGRPFTRNERIGEFIIGLILLIALFATQSRTGLVIAWSALLIWFALGLVKGRALHGPLLHAGLALLAMGVVLVVAPADLVANRVASLGMGFSIRQDLIQAGWQMFKDHPIGGVGAFCFSLMYGAYRPLSEQLTAGMFVHNDYVQLLAEGGVLLMVLPLVLAFAATRATFRGVRGSVDAPAFDRLGPALAIGAACAHAFVNFVFYSLPLVIIMGVLAAAMIDRATTAAPDATRSGGLIVVAGITFAWVAWLYLAADLVTVAVFQGQPGVPFSDHIRSDADAQLRYARLAQDFNDDRGIPVLAEAMLLARKSDQDQAPPSLVERTLQQFRLAVEVDPWNPLGYTSFADFVSKHGRELVLRADEQPKMLLFKALALDPIEVTAIDRLLELNRADRRLGDSYALLKNVVFPWLELLKRRDDVAAGRYLDEMSQLASRAGDDEFARAIEAKRLALARVAPAVYRRWFE